MTDQELQAELDYFFANGAPDMGTPCGLLLRLIIDSLEKTYCDSGIQVAWLKPPKNYIVTPKEVHIVTETIRFCTELLNKADSDGLVHDVDLDKLVRHVAQIPARL